MNEQYKHLLDKSVVFVLDTGEDVLLKVQALTPYSIRGRDEQWQRTEISKKSIVDYYIPQK